MLFFLRKRSLWQEKNKLIGKPKDSSLIARTIARNRVLILAAPAFIKSYGLPEKIEYLADLPAATFASTTSRVENIHYLNQRGESEEQKMKSVFRANGGDALLMKTLAGSAYFVGPAFLIGGEIKEGRLVPLLTDLQLKEYHPMYAVYPHRDLPVRTRLFFDAVCEYLGKDKPLWDQAIPNFEELYQS